jgi:hypothetical protein
LEERLLETADLGKRHFQNYVEMKNMYQELLKKSAVIMKKKGGKNLKYDPTMLVPSNDGWERSARDLKLLVSTYESKSKEIDKYYKQKEAEVR